jgi:hypothetical protein
MYSLPKKLPIFFALAGDSTITKVFLALINPPNFSTKALFNLLSRYLTSYLTREVAARSNLD